MPDSQPEKSARSTVQVVLGFLLGVVITLGCLFFAIFLGSALAMRQQWLYPVIIAIALVLAGIIALRHVRESSYALGVVIALALGLLLDAACGVFLH
jgi:uncharacterized membrane protein YccC